MRFTFGQRLRYWFDNTMAKGTPAMITMLALLVGVLVIIGGVLVVLIDPGADGEVSILGAWWMALMRALDAGTITGDDTSHPAFVAISFGITMGGLLIFSALIGVLSAGIDSKLEQLRKGRSLVVERNHTVVLGWSEQVFTVLSELVEANTNLRRGCVAVLADKDKVEMEDEIRDKLGSTKNTQVVCRSGDPIDPDDIRIVNPKDARGVIVLPSESDDPDAQLVKTLLAVTKGAAERPKPLQVVGAVTQSRNMAAARLAGGPATHLIDVDDVAARLIVQTCRQSGLSVVYTDLLDFGGDEIYMQEEPRLVGYTFGDAVGAYRTSSIIGLLTPDGRISLNPPMTTRIEPGCKIIAISEDDDTVVLNDTRPVIVEPAITGNVGRWQMPERTLLLGWNARARGIITQFDAYVAPGSVLDVVADRPDAEAAITQLGGSLRNLAVNFKADDSSDRDVLDSLNVGSYQHTIVLCCDDVPPQLADSRTLVTLLHLRDIERRSGQRMAIVSEMADDRNRGLAQVTQADDFIVSGKLIGLMMTQVSENPHLAGVFGDLFDPDGSEIYLKPAEHYIRPGTEVNFFTVVEAAKRRGEVALGYRVWAKAHEAPNYGVELNPDKAQSIMFAPGDRLIVLAED